MKDSFWSGGAEAHDKAIREYYQEQIKEVELRIIYCADEQERALLRVRLESIEKKYREKRRASGRFIF